MSFCWVTLPVKNLDASLAFYNGIFKLAIASTHSGSGIKMAMLGNDNNAKIELISLPDTQEKTLHSDISIGIEVESIEYAIKLLKSHSIPILRGPISPTPYVSFLYVHDPDGYEVQLVELKK